MRKACVLFISLKSFSPCPDGILISLSLIFSISPCSLPSLPRKLLIHANLSQFAKSVFKDSLSWRAYPGVIVPLMLDTASPLQLHFESHFVMLWFCVALRWIIHRVHRKVVQMKPQSMANYVRALVVLLLLHCGTIGSVDAKAVSN